MASSRLFSGPLPVVLLAALLGLLGGFFRRAFLPPPPLICGSSSGPPVTAPRFMLRDGRHLAYKESGVPRETANYKVVFVHGFLSSRNSVPAFDQDLLEENRIFVVSFDRAGYGESDPNPTRDIKSEAYDIEQLADYLELGQRFFVLAHSIGGYSAWGCLRYIPHRLAGVGMISPVTNYWWPGVSRDEFKLAMESQASPDRWFLRVTHHLPWLTYWWITQGLFPTSSAVQPRRHVYGAWDQQALSQFAASSMLKEREVATQQGVAESLCRDVVVMFGKWEFDPGNLEDPFPDSPGSVHIWQADDDYLVPVVLQRYIHRSLPWIRYHEIKGKGHFLRFFDGFFDNVLKTLLLREEIELN